MRRMTVIFLILFQTSFQNCGNPGTSPSGDNRILTEIEKEITANSNSFGFELFRESLENSAEINVVLSPFSVSMALGMTLNGASGKTFDDMKTTLGFEDMSPDEINQSYRNLIDILQSIDNSVDFQIANSIWCREGFPVQDTFITTNTHYFDALIQSLDFSRSDAADIINAWVNENTNEKIPQIVEPPIDATTIMFLINAIYFNGSWTYEFNPDLTMTAPFYISSSEQIDCQLMNYKCEHLYYEDNTCQVVDLPYGAGNYRMLVILPEWNIDIDSFISEIDQTVWNTWLDDLQKTEMNLYLPKFKVEYKKKLNDVLSQLGMSVAFNPVQADFSRINPDVRLYISKVMHKTFIDVSEEGTEAAAVTSVEICFTSTGGGGESIPTMRVDHPFIFAIHEIDTGAILFLGKISKPEYPE